MGKLLAGLRQWILGRSIATLLAGIVLMAGLPAIAIIVASSFDARQQAESRAWDEIGNLTRSLAALQQGVLHQAQGVLAALAHTDAAGSRDLPELNRVFASLLDDHPELSNIFLTDAAGRVVASGLPAFLGVDLSDRKYFQETVATGTFSVSGFIHGRATRKPILAFSMPDKDAAGRFLGVIGLSYYLDGYERFLNRIELPPKTRITFIDPDGKRMVAYPLDERFPLGVALVPRLWKLLGREPGDEGTFLAPRFTGGDGLFSFARLRLAPERPPYMTILVSAACDDVFQNADRQLRRGLISAVLATLLALAIALAAGRVSLGRGIASLADAADRLAAGDLDARAGADAGSLEVRRLGASFDAMADALQQRDQELEQAATALAKMRSMLHNILESMPSAIIGLDGTGHVTHVNDTASRLFGLDKDAAMGRDAVASLPLLGGYMQTVEQALRERRSLVVEKLSLPQDGDTHFLDMLFYPLVANGAEGVVIRFDDVTDRERALEEKTVLLKEIHHRVKNNLQIILSFIGLQADDAEDPAERDRLRRLEIRIRSMALVHQQLYSHGDFAAIDLAEYLRVLTEGVCNVYADVASRVRLRLETESVRLPLDKAVPCGLLCSELLTNACKHAFPGERTGNLRVGCRQEGGFARIWVEDDGEGLPPGFDAAGDSGMGMTLVAELTRQLEGAASFSTPPGGGLRFEATFPVEPTQDAEEVVLATP